MLQEYINKNIEKAFIWHYKSLPSVPFLFVKNKYLTRVLIIVD
jgi:hypothetical protein